MRTSSGILKSPVPKAKPKRFFSKPSRKIRRRTQAPPHSRKAWKEYRKGKEFRALTPNPTA